jgi:hypothetical protein
MATVYASATSLRVTGLSCAQAQFSLVDLINNCMEPAVTLPIDNPSTVADNASSTPDIVEDSSGLISEGKSSASPGAKISRNTLPSPAIVGPAFTHELRRIE